MSEKPNATNLENLQRALGYVALLVAKGGDDCADFLAWMERQIEVAQKGDPKAHAQALLEKLKMRGR